MKPLRNLICTHSLFNQPDMISVFCITVMFVTVDLYTVFQPDVGKCLGFASLQNFTCPAEMANS
jgi:hypothetical protein